MQPQRFANDRIITKLLLGLASTVIFGFESRGTHDHILLSDGSGNLPGPPPEMDLVCFVTSFKSLVRTSQKSPINLAAISNTTARNAQRKMTVTICL
jgi:hypothetical protein